MKRFLIYSVAAILLVGVTVAATRGMNPTTMDVKLNTTHVSTLVYGSITFPDSVVLTIRSIYLPESADPDSVNLPFGVDSTLVAGKYPVGTKTIVYLPTSE